MLCLQPYSKRFKLEFIVTNDTDVIKNADCYFIFYDVTCLHSLNFAKNLIENKILNQKKPIFLIGNKIDLKMNVELDLLNYYVSIYNLKLFNISIKESNGISSLLEKLGEVLDYKDEIEIMNN
jgi:predicted GTPase